MSQNGGLSEACYIHTMDYQRVIKSYTMGKCKYCNEGEETGNKQNCIITMIF